MRWRDDKLFQSLKFAGEFTSVVHIQDNTWIPTPISHLSSFVMFRWDINASSSNQTYIRNRSAFSTSDSGATQSILQWLYMKSLISKSKHAFSKLIQQRPIAF